MQKFHCDVHTHTLFSRHAYSTIEENVRAAKQRGIELLGTTDHISSMLFPGEASIKNFQYITNMVYLPRHWDGVTLLFGAEMDLVDTQGHLYGWDIPCQQRITGQPYPTEKTLEERITRKLDYLIASVHYKDFTLDAGIVKNTEMYLKALDHPKVHILGHIGRSGVSFDLDEVLTYAAKKNKLIEINEHSMDDSEKICETIAVRCAELGVGISVSSDAHCSYFIGKFNRVESMLEKIGFPQENIMTQSGERFLRSLEKSGVCKPGFCAKL